MRKIRNDTEKDGVVAGKKNFVATVQTRVARTLGVIAQNGGATSTITHMDKITLAIGVEVVAKNGDATSAITRVGKINPAMGAEVVTQK